MSEMSTSQVLRVPDLSKLQLSEKQRTLFVRDDQIFREMLLLHRENVDRQGEMYALSDFLIMVFVMVSEAVT